MRMSFRCLRAANVWIIMLAAMLPAGGAHALPRYGPLEVTGSLAAQQLFRTPDVDEWQFIQQRNTLKLRVDYKALQEGKLISRFNVDFLDEVRLFMLYRGVYDSVYSYVPIFKQRDVYGLPVTICADPAQCSPLPIPPAELPATRPLSLRDLGNRDELQFENVLREAYVDFGFKDVPLSFRVGRQMIVWGETDQFRLLDRVNSLDLSWHLQQESWDELRIPYWMIKGLYTIPRLGPLTDTFFEFYWNPGDWYPSKRGFIPMPWSVPVTDPLQIAFSAYGTICNPEMPAPGCPGVPINSLYLGTRLFTQGNYSRSPGQNSQAGIRFSGVTPQGVQATAAYFYGRWANDDGTNTASVRAVLDANEANAAFARGELPIEATMPYVHAFGMSANYSEEDYTQTVYRLETIYELGVPFSDASKPLSGVEGINPLLPLVLGQDVFGVSKRDMWKGFIGFDRPTWIRALNRRTTIFLTGQFFWHYLIDNPLPGCIDQPGPCVQNRGFRGGFSLSPMGADALARTRGYFNPGTQPLSPFAVQPFIDKVRSWEALMTIAATTFYKGGSIVPFVAYVLDPVNSFNQEIIWTLDYYVTNNFIVNIGQRYFMRAGSAPAFETWGVGGVNRGRSETQLRLTYQY